MVRTFVTDSEEPHRFPQNSASPQIYGGIFFNLGSSEESFVNSVENYLIELLSTLPNVKMTFGVSNLWKNANYQNLLID